MEVGRALVSACSAFDRYEQATVQWKKEWEYLQALEERHESRNRRAPSTESTPSTHERKTEKEKRHQESQIQPRP